MPGPDTRGSVGEQKAQVVIAQRVVRHMGERYESRFNRPRLQKLYAAVYVGENPCGTLPNAPVDVEAGDRSAMS